MIQSLPYQFEPKLFTNLRFTLLRNTVQPLILILSHRNCHGWGYTKTNMHQSAIFTERRTATCFGYRVSHTDTGKSPPRTKYRNNLRKTKHVFL